MSNPFCCSPVLLDGMEEPGGLPQIPDLPRVPASTSVSFPEEFLEMEEAWRVEMFFL